MKNNPFYIEIPNMRIFAKARPRIGKYGNWYSPSSEKELDLADEVSLQMLRKKLHCFKKEARLAIDCRFYFKGKANLDCDNVLKSLLDSIQGVAFHNDKQIKKGSVEIVENCLENRIEFSLKKLNEQS